MESVQESISTRKVNSHGEEAAVKGASIAGSTCVKATLESSEAFTGIFPETFKLLNIILALPVGTATVERSFSQLKWIKTKLHNRISDCNLARLMHNAIQGPELLSVDFTNVLEVYKEKNHRILL